MLECINYVSFRSVQRFRTFFIFLFLSFFTFLEDLVRDNSFLLVKYNTNHELVALGGV
jgi:hypothetical protein